MTNWWDEVNELTQWQDEIFFSLCETYALVSAIALIEKQQFHCDDCGICRVGGRENFFHCKKCGSCSTGLHNNHRCVEDSMRHHCIDRRLIPQDYLSFVSGFFDELGEFGAEIKLSLFQLGLSPQIIASIIMQVLCHVLPSLVKLRKEGLDGHEKIKSYMCV